MEESSSTGANIKSKAPKDLSTSCNDFTKAFYMELSSTSNGNTISSPLSIHMILSYLSHGADSITLDEFTESLCHYDKNSVKEGYLSLITELNGMKNVKLYIANMMYVQNEFELMAEFLTLGKEVYHSEISNVDFKLNVNTANKINNWVKEKTNNKIQSVVSSDDFDEYTKLVLINAIYFNGNWMSAFNSKTTEDRIFHVTRDQTKLVPTMYQKSMYNYGNIPKLDAKFIEIPYMDPDIAMMIILPNEVDGLPNVQKNFVWKLLATASKNYDDVELYLPKFKVEFTLNLKHILQKLGLNTMFDSEANFNRMSKLPLVVSKILHKAVIDVNETGTEAAAATSVHVRLRRMINTNKPEKFVVDRPFMFIIEYKPNNIPIFIGSINDIAVTPQKDEL